MMNLFSEQGLEQEEDFESGLCVCLWFCFKKCWDRETEGARAMEGGAGTTGLENQAVNSRSKKCPVWEEWCTSVR